MRPELTIETLLIRALGAAAFTLLNVILCIGPLARLDRRFLPLLYNRRHLGVMMFTLALSHGVFSIVQFHAVGTLNPLVSVLVGNDRYGTIAQLPFQPFGLAALGILFLMAATSHDFWLHNLTAPVWKALHMCVYVAYTLIVAHVIFGVLQEEVSPWLGWALCGAVLTVFTLHLVAARREAAGDRENRNANRDGFVDVCGVDGDSGKARGGDLRLGRACRGLPVRRPNLGALQRVSAPERSAGRRTDRQRLCRVPVAWLRIPARHGRLAGAVHREGPDLRRSRAGRSCPRAPTAPRARDAGRACGSGGGSNGMSDRDEFFIGYAPPMPSGIGRFVGKVVTGLVLGVLAWAAVIASGHVPLEGGTFEFGHPQRFAGTIVERPYPALRLDGTDRSVPAQLLVAPGKHGADAAIQGLNGRHASLAGTRYSTRHADDDRDRARVSGPGRRIRIRPRHRRTG